jgi:hypothetical protein
MKIRADRRVGILLGGVLLATLVAIGGTVVLPATDAALDVKDAKLSDDAQRGMEIFRKEGLWQCDTTYVRETAIDRGRTGNPATKAEQVAGQAPVMLGLEQVGDLCGVELSESDTAAVGAFLASRNR